MYDILRYVLGLLVIASLTGVYGFLSVLGFSKVRKQEIEKDIVEFGHCCGLENGVCTYEPKIKKNNKKDLVVHKTKTTNIDK